MQKLEVISTLLSEEGIDSAWIGASDQVDTDYITFVETGDQVTDGLWASGEPTHGNGDCVRLDSNLERLEVFDCETPQSYVCEFYE